MAYIPGPTLTAAKPALYLELGTLPDSTLLQSFAQCPSTGRWFLAQAVNDDTYIHPFTADGKRDGAPMIWVGGGHGSDIDCLPGEQIMGNFNGGGPDVCLVKFKAGKMSKSQTRKLNFHTSNYAVPAVDVPADLVAVRTVRSDGSEHYTVRHLTDVLAGKDKVLGTFGGWQADAETFQGIAVSGATLYRLTGKTNGKTEHGSGKFHAALIHEYAWATGKETGKRNITGLGARPGDPATMSEEPEGIAVSPRGGLLVGFKRGSGAARRFRLVTITPSGSDPPDMAWRLAPTLAQLIKELNADWPLRDKTSDGTLGNAAHAASLSDHNPDSRRVVCAIDVDEDLGGSKATAYPRFNAGAPAKTRLVESLLALAKAGKLPQLRYVIYEGLIYQDKNGFAPKKYTGRNAHDHHVHISVYHEPKHADRRAPWNVGPVVKITAPTPVPATFAGKTIDLMGKRVADINTVSAARINAASGTDVASIDVWYMQAWLRAIKLYPGVLDGLWHSKSKTQAGLDSYRANDLKLTGEDARGAVGPFSLGKLAADAKSPKKTGK